MTEEQSNALRDALEKIHDDLHGLYPAHSGLSETDKQLRNRLLIVDLAVHLADEVLKSGDPDQSKLTERTVNLLYAVRLLAPDYEFEAAAGILAHSQASADAAVIA